MPGPSESAALDLTLAVARARRAHGRAVPRGLWVWAAFGVALVWAFGLMPGLAGTCGLAAIATYVASVRSARASPTWPYEVATVVESRLHCDAPPADDAEGSAPVCRPVALLEYEVGGKTYLGTTVPFVEGMRDRAAAEHELATTWAVGNTVGIRADPSDPFRFLLDGADPESVAHAHRWLVVVGLVFLGAAVVVYLT